MNLSLSQTYDLEKPTQFYKIAKFFKFYNYQTKKQYNKVLIPKIFLNNLLAPQPKIQFQRQMAPSKKQQEKLPMLLFLLEHRKYQELIKSLFNENIAKKFLLEYGHQKQQFSKFQQFKMNQDAEHFSIQDLIEIKGSNDKKVKRFQNSILIQTILRKLKSNYLVQAYQRKLFWLQFTEIYISHNLYEGLTDLQLPPDTECILDKDVKRTYYNIPTQSSQEKQSCTQTLRTSIKQSLSHFALYNPFLLYCQGMNEIFGFLHEQNYSPKQTFFIFKRITEVLLPSDYYSSLEGIISYLKVLWEMLAVNYPKIYQKLNFLVRQMNLNGNYLCVFSNALQWFVCLFTNTMLNRQIRRTIMDYFLLQGITALFKASLAIYQYLQETILQVTSFQTYVIKVQQAVRKYDNVQHLRRILNKKFISKEILFLMKQYQACPKQVTSKKLLPFTKKCSRKWNFCLQQLQNNISHQHKYQFFVFKRKQNVKVIPDYMSRLNTYYFQNKKNTKQIDLLRIGRMAHICNHVSEQGTEDSLSENNKRKQSPLTSRYSPSPSRNYIVNIKTVEQPMKKQNNNLTVKQSQYPKTQQFTSNQPMTLEPRNPNQISESVIAVNDNESVYHRKQTLEYREMIKLKLLHQAEKKVLQKSESMMFMKMMVDNESYSNLFSLLQNQQMDKMFDINSQSDQQSQSSASENPLYGKSKM